MATFLHDPDSTLDYGWDWSKWLDDGDAIQSYIFETDGGVTVDSHTETAGIVTAWISGGDFCATATVTCRITTTGGRTDDRTMQLYVVQR